MPPTATGDCIEELECAKCKLSLDQRWTHLHQRVCDIDNTKDGALLHIGQRIDNRPNWQIFIAVIGLIAIVIAMTFGYIYKVEQDYKEKEAKIWATVMTKDDFEDFKRELFETLKRR